MHNLITAWLLQLQVKRRHQWQSYWAVNIFGSIWYNLQSVRIGALQVFN